jgi:hypothetical protein
MTLLLKHLYNQEDFCGTALPLTKSARPWLTGLAKMMNNVMPAKNPMLVTSTA